MAGSCYSAVGSVAGLGPARTGVVWFDSHADFNTPDTTVTGFLDGMALAILTGRCWSQLASGVPGFRPVPDGNVCLLAARDLDRLEAERLESSEIVVLSPERVRADLDSSLRLLSAQVEQLYIHIDLDVLDPSEGRANELVAPGGLTLEDTVAALRTAGQVSRIGGVAFTAYDPALDEGGKVCGAAFTLLDTVLEVVAAARSCTD